MLSQLIVYFDTKERSRYKLNIYLINNRNPFNLKSKISNLKSPCLLDLENNLLNTGCKVTRR